MNSKTQRQIVAQIESVARKSNVSSSEISFDQALRIFSVEGGAVVLEGQFIIAEYEDIYTRLVQDEGWGEKFSEKYVDKQLRAIIGKLVREKSTKNAALYFTKFVNEFEAYNSEHIVYTLLAGIALPGDDLLFGNITLRRLTDELVDDIQKTVDSVVLASLNTDEAKQSQIQWQRARLDELKGHNIVCAEYRVVAEPDRAIERAEEEIRRVLDILRFGIPVVTIEGHRVSIGLWGELSRTPRLTTVLAVDGESFSLVPKMIGPLAPLVLSQDNLDELRRIGAFELSEILQKTSTELTPFEIILLRALHWFANARTQTEVENKLLSLVTCLEVFFTPEAGKTITGAVAESVAFVLSEDPKTRMILYDRVKKLYGKRSRITHGGSKAILDKELDELETIAGEVMVKMVQRRSEFPDQKALFSWIRNQKFGQVNHVQNNDSDSTAS